MSTTQTPQTIATQTADNVRFAQANGVHPDSLSAFSARHIAAIKHELGPNASKQQVISTVMKRYSARYPAQKPIAKPLLNEFAVGDTVKVRIGREVFKLTPQNCTGSIVHIDRETATILIVGASTLTNGVPLSWLSLHLDPRVSLPNQITTLLSRIQQLSAPAEDIDDDYEPTADEEAADYHLGELIMSTNFASSDDDDDDDDYEPTADEEAADYHRSEIMDSIGK
jgi:hypothetical protein